jgi:hypothetical protein
MGLRHTLRYHPLPAEAYQSAAANIDNVYLSAEMGP